MMRSLKRLPGKLWFRFKSKAGLGVCLVYSSKTRVYFQFCDSGNFKRFYSCTIKEFLESNPDFEVYFKDDSN